METGTGLDDWRSDCARARAGRPGLSPGFTTRERAENRTRARSGAGRGRQGLRGFRSGRAPRDPARSRLGGEFRRRCHGRIRPADLRGAQALRGGGQAPAGRPADARGAPASGEDGGCGPEGLCLCHRKRSDLEDAHRRAHAHPQQALDRPGGPLALAGCG